MEAAAHTGSVPTAVALPIHGRNVGRKLHPTDAAAVQTHPATPPFALKAVERDPLHPVSKSVNLPLAYMS